MVDDFLGFVDVLISVFVDFFAFAGDGLPSCGDFIFDELSLAVGGDVEVPVGENAGAGD